MLFKNVTGSSLVSYIIEKRIARARQLMYEDLEITEIAERVGYHNYSNFYKAFKKASRHQPGRVPAAAEHLRQIKNPFLI